MHPSIAILIGRQLLFIRTYFSCAGKLAASHVSDETIIKKMSQRMQELMPPRMAEMGLQATVAKVQTQLIRKHIYIYVLYICSSVSLRILIVRCQYFMDIMSVSVLMHLLCCFF
jgi:hypothetical protein